MRGHRATAIRESVGEKGGGWCYIVIEIISVEIRAECLLERVAPPGTREQVRGMDGRDSDNLCPGDGRIHFLFRIAGTLAGGIGAFDPDTAEMFRDEPASGRQAAANSGRTECFPADRGITDC